VVKVCLRFGVITRPLKDLAMSFEAVLKQQHAGKASRAAERRSLKLQTRTRSASAGDVLVVVHNISPTGLLIEASQNGLAVGDSFTIDVPEAGLAESTVVWNSGRFFGCAFLEPIAKAAVSAALLRGEPQPDAARTDFADVRTGHSGTLDRPKLVPERNFLVPVILAFGLWGLIGTAVYFAFF
jgi:hypothetical protein